MDKRKTASRREPYAPPKLKEFGPVGLLTQAGTGLISEVMAMGPVSMNPNRQRI
jgi:hypothetical protein